jgi:nitroreductase
MAVRLPRPRLGRGRSLAESLRRRRTTREIGVRKLPLQQLSNLLWAACGTNRRTGPFGYGGHTAASASNSQEIDLYVALEDGVHRFDPQRHSLVPVVAGDLRALALGRGQRASVEMQAPVQLIYVADVHRLTHTRGFQEPGLHDPEVQKSYYYVDTGLIAANVYLFAASEGLACWFHNCDKPALAERLRLGPEQKVLFGQSVGYPERTRHSASEARP